jgi:hypothetical protein
MQAARTTARIAAAGKAERGCIEVEGGGWRWRWRVEGGGSRVGRRCEERSDAAISS